MHLIEDSIALIQHRKKVPHADMMIDAFLFTSLLPFAPKILLNVESGDYGTIEKRNCGCRFDELGYSKHIYNIRSFDKLTTAGVSIGIADIIKIVEEILPTRFGGSSIDYQIIEEEDEAGQTLLSIIISPDVGVVDENALINTILSVLAQDGNSKRMMSEIWYQTKTLKVRRRLPYTTTQGKLLPLHIKDNF
jgi:hypothetical protein